MWAEKGEQKKKNRHYNGDGVKSNLKVCRIVSFGDTTVSHFIKFHFILNVVLLSDALQFAYTFIETKVIPNGVATALRKIS